MSIRIAIAPGDRVVPWINQCYPGWPVKPLKYITKINNRSLGEDTASDFEINYIDISSVASNGQQNPAETIAFGDAPSRARRIVASGDVIISTVRTYLKAISYIENANDNLICSTGFAVITSGPRVHPKFLLYWVRSEWFVNEIMARSVGVSYPAINAIEIGNLPFPAIPVDEQKAIADFLDRETAGIDELIAKKKKLIELLQERRTALISRAITKGLNPDAPMRDSGIEWLGEIPAHWEIKRADALLRQSGKPAYIEEMADKEVFHYSIPIIQETGDGQIEDGTNIDSNKTLIAEPVLLVSKLNPRKNTIIIAFPNEKITVCSGEFVPLAPINCNLKYAEHVYKSEYVRQLLSSSVQSATRSHQRVSPDLIRKIWLAWPSLEEQQAIADFLDQETARIDNLVGRTNQAIEKLQEYRAALITAAVTGKIDVRGEIVRYE